MKSFAGFDVARQLEKGEVKEFLGKLDTCSLDLRRRAQWRLVPGYAHESLLESLAVLPVSLP